MDQPLGAVVIGGSQAGLSVGYHLKQRGMPFLILDEHDRIGDAWRKRWDSLRLFTPGRYDCLPGMRFPGPPSAYPTKDGIADYLESYTRAFDLPVRTGTRVDRVSKAGNRFAVICGKDALFCENVVVATGASHHPRIPPFAHELDQRIFQLHSKQVPEPVAGSGRRRADRWCGQLRSRDCDRARSPPPDVVIGPRHGPGAHTRRHSSRSTGHADPLVHGDPGIEGHQSTRKKNARPLSQPSARNPARPRATEGFCGRRHRESGASDGSEGRSTCLGGWKGPRCVERHLVHGIHTELRLDRSPAADPKRLSRPYSRRRSVVPRALLRRLALPLLAELAAGGRCRTGRQTHRRSHRFRAS